MGNFIYKTKAATKAEAEALATAYMGQAHLLGVKARSKGSGGGHTKTIMEASNVIIASVKKDTETGIYTVTGTCDTEKSEVES